MDAAASSLLPAPPPLGGGAGLVVVEAEDLDLGVRRLESGAEVLRHKLSHVPTTTSLHASLPRFQRCPASSAALYSGVQRQLSQPGEASGSFCTVTAQSESTPRAYGTARAPLRWHLHPPRDIGDSAR